MYIFKNTFANIANYDIDDIKKYTESEHIEDLYYTYTIQLAGNNLERAQLEDQPSTNNRFNGAPGSEMMNNDNFTLTGYSSVESMAEFIDGTYTMAELADDA